MQWGQGQGMGMGKGHGQEPPEPAVPLQRAALAAPDPHHAALGPPPAPCGCSEQDGALQGAVPSPTTDSRGKRCIKTILQERFQHHSSLFGSEQPRRSPPSNGTITSLQSHPPPPPFSSPLIPFLLSPRLSEGHRNTNLGKYFKIKHLPTNTPIPIPAPPPPPSPRALSVNL